MNTQLKISFVSGELIGEETPSPGDNFLVLHLVIDLPNGFYNKIESMRNHIYF